MRLSWLSVKRSSGSNSRSHLKTIPNLEHSSPAKSCPSLIGLAVSGSSTLAASSDGKVNSQQAKAKMSNPSLSRASSPKPLQFKWPKIISTIGEAWHLRRAHQQNPVADENSFRLLEPHLELTHKQALDPYFIAPNKIDWRVLFSDMEKMSQPLVSPFPRYQMCNINLKTIEIIWLESIDNMTASPSSTRRTDADTDGNDIFAKFNTLLESFFTFDSDPNTPKAACYSGGHVREWMRMRGYVYLVENHPSPEAYKKLIDALWECHWA